VGVYAPWFTLIQGFQGGGKGRVHNGQSSKSPKNRTETFWTGDEGNASLTFMGPKRGYQVPFVEKWGKSVPKRHKESGFAGIERGCVG